MNARVRAMDYRYLDRLAGRDKPKSQEHPRCVACGYDLYGSVSDRCPECGHVIDDEEWRRLVREMEGKLAEIEDTLQWTPLAWKLVVAGVVLQLLRLTPLLGGCADGLARIVVFLCGVGAFFIGMNVFRLRGIPSWAQGRLKFKPDAVSSGVGLAGGLLLVAAAIGL